METLGLTSHFRLGDSINGLKETMSSAGASLELSTSIGVVALLDPDCARDPRSEWSVNGNEERDDKEEDSFMDAPFCTALDVVVDKGAAWDTGASSKWSDTEGSDDSGDESLCEETFCAGGIGLDSVWDGCGVGTGGLLFLNSL